MKKVFVPVFPGSNCEVETLAWLTGNLEVEGEFLNLKKHAALGKDEVAAVVIPGGFSYGDYLRAGAIAARSPEMKYIARLAEQGVPVLGICNGFQILCEAGLLPGVLIHNITKQHHHFPARLTIPREKLADLGKKSAWFPAPENERELDALTIRYADFTIPISCGMGNFVPPPGGSATVGRSLEAGFFYIHNENGSADSIACLVSTCGKIVGTMPHPERASDPLLGHDDGLLFLLGLSRSQKIAIRTSSHLERYKNSLLDEVR